MDLFAQLGKEIEDAWRRQDYDESLLPALAADALRRADLPAKLTAWDVIEWTLDQTALPPQKDPAATFGDPPLTVFVAPRFYIDVYFWLNGTTQIHQHGFSGAFQVLLGSSIHSWYEFERTDVVNSFMEIGEMRLKLCELLKVGDVQEIRAGRQYIHSLFHLEQPSATIVVRTDKSPLYLPQFSYHKPCIALDPFYEDITLTRKLQALDVLFQTDRPDADRCVTELLERSDFQTGFSILSYLHRALTTGALKELFALESPATQFSTYLEIVQRRHGSKSDDLEAVFAYRDRTNEIIRRRSYVTDAEHRFFFALLLNVEGGERILGLIHGRFPEADPVEKILDWTHDLAQTRVAGVNTPNALGVEDFGAVDLTILEHLLRGKPVADIGDAVTSEFGQEKASTADVDAKIKRILASNVFHPLFA